MTDEEVIEKALARKTRHVIKLKDLLSSGSTLLNKAATGRTTGCWAKGHYYWFVGDSKSGKTWLALSAFAEASINPEFDNYRLIYDNSERGALMNIERYFGAKVAERLEPPRGTKEEPIHSELVEDFYYHVDEAAKQGEPFIYILDSMDVLNAKDDEEKFEEMKQHRLKDSKRKMSGTFGMAKAKVNSTMLRRIISRIHKTGSIVIIISQTRANVKFGSQFNPKTAAGGDALLFYATTEIWTSIKETLKRRVRKKDRKVGILSKIQLKKNRITGRDRTVEVPIYYSNGIDDVGSCIEYLKSEDHWKGKEDSVNAPEFDFSGSVEDLVHRIEENNLESKLRKLVGRVYEEIEIASEVKRKNRYT